MRLALAAATLATTAVLTPPTAAHHGNVVIRCVVSFGASGSSSGSGACAVSGTIHGWSHSDTPASIMFTTVSGPCPLSRTASGQLTIDSSPSASLAFAISRVGPTGVVSTSGGLQGSGAATFVGLIPMGYACSGTAHEYWQLAVTS